MRAARATQAGGTELSRVDLLTPTAVAIAVAVLIPLLALALGTLRGARARRAVGLAPLGYRGVVAPAVAVALACGLLAVAAAQPVLRSRATVRARTDAAAWIVVDTSRSMLASSGSGGPQRIARARRAALVVRADLPRIPVGIASVNDRVLPHLFPSPDRAAFASTIARTIQPGQPVPVGGGRTGTNLTALAAVPTLNFFAPEIRHRAVVVITDAESDPVDVGAIARAYRAAPAPALVVLRIGGAGEQVYDERGRPEPAYDAVTTAPATAKSVAAAAGGRAFTEGEARQAARAVLTSLGRHGPTEPHGRGERRTALAPYAVAAAALPLAWLLRRRNFL
jgi:hypothetical protein